MGFLFVRKSKYEELERKLEDAALERDLLKLELEGNSLGFCSHPSGLRDREKEAKKLAGTWKERHDRLERKNGDLHSQLAIARDAITQAQKALNVALPPTIEHKVKVGGGE